jgi:hypothetical protein
MKLKLKYNTHHNLYMVQNTTVFGICKMFFENV